MGIKCIGDILRLEEVVDYLRHQKKLKESQCVLWENDEYRKNTCVELVSSFVQYCVVLSCAVLCFVPALS